MKFILLLFILVTALSSVFAQDDDGLILGKTSKQSSAAVYDISDPTGVNIEVNLWGFVRFPGRYIVPVKTTFMDLITYAGGPTETSDLKQIRIIRNATTPGEKPKLIKLDYNDLLWEDNVKTVSMVNPELLSGDVILILEEKRYSFREDLGIILPIVTTVITITAFIITLTNK